MRRHRRFLPHQACAATAEMFARLNAANVNDSKESLVRLSPLSLKILLNLFLVYVSWGSTYIGFKFTLEVLGPFLACGARMVLAGVVLSAAIACAGRWKRPGPGRLAARSLARFVYGADGQRLSGQGAGKHYFRRGRGGHRLHAYFHAGGGLVVRRRAASFGYAMAGPCGRTVRPDPAGQKSRRGRRA